MGYLNKEVDLIVVTEYDTFLERVSTRVLRLASRPNTDIMHSDMVRVGWIYKPLIPNWWGLAESKAFKKAGYIQSDKIIHSRSKSRHYGKNLLWQKREQWTMAQTKTLSNATKTRSIG